MSKAVPKLRFREFTDQWHVNALAPNIDILSGVPIKSEDISEDENGVPILRGINITEGSIRHSKDIDRYYLNGIEELTKFLVDEGDLVIGMDGSKVGKNVSLVSKKDSGSILIQRVARIRNKSSSDIRFIYHHIFSPRFHRYVDEVNTSSGIPHISLKQINEFKIGFPSLPEQQKIASFLSAVDEKIQQLTRKKELLEQYKKGVMQQLFSSSELGFVGLEDDRISEEGLGDDRIDADDKNNPTILKSKKSKFRQLRFKDENGKAYPKWEEKRLGEVCESIKSGRDKASEEGSFPLYGSTGKIGNSNEYSHDGNYILIARVGANAGTINLIDGKFAVSDNTLVVSCYDKKSIKYVFYYLNFFNLNKLIFGSGQPLITGGQLKDLQLPFPSKEEQQKIANFLSAIDAKIETVATQIEKTQTFKKGLLQQMFV